MLSLKRPALFVRFAAIMLVIVGAVDPAYAFSALARDPVVGFWRTQDGDGTIEIYPCGDQICGRFHWLRDDDPAHIARDTENPNPDHHHRPLCGLQFMGGFDPVPTGRYESGWIYDPRGGSTYSASMALENHDTLDLHGYVLTPLLGASQTWTRTDPQPACVTERL